MSTPSPFLPDAPDDRGANLWRNRDFNVYWSGQAMSVVGDGFAAIATPLLVLRATSSLRVMGALTATVAAGSVIAGFASGALVDKVDRRRLMIGCDVGRAFLWSLVPLAFASGHRAFMLALLFGVALSSAVLGNAFQVACITAVPNLVGRSAIVRANSRLHSTYAVMFLAGQTVSGLVCARFGPVVAIGCNAGSFVLSAVSLSFVRIVRPAGPDDELPVRVTRRRIDELLAGARFLARQPLLRAIGLLLALGNLLQAARVDLLIYHLLHTLHRHDDDVGITLGLAGVGSLMSGALTPALQKRYGYARTWLGCGVVQAVALVALGVVPTVQCFALAMVLLGFADTTRGISAQSLRQVVTPDRLLGRVTAAFWTLLNLPLPLGAALTTQLAAHTSTGRTLTSIGLASLGLTFIGLRAVPRGRQHEALVAEDEASDVG